MPRNKDIFRRKDQFAHEEFATEFYKPEGRPQPREAKSQKAQLESKYNPGETKGIKK